MESIWSKTCDIEERESLKGNIETETAVIGAGMAGCLTAYELQKAGKDVIVLEAGSIGSGQTCHTTAKITSQHGIIYQYLIKTFGEELARQYAKANEAALWAYRELIKKEGIECDFEERDAYVYSDDLQQLKDEAEAAVSLGLPASFVRHLDIPVPAAGAVKFEHQAQFNPLKFLKAITKDLCIYENSLAKVVDEHTLKTDKGVVKAKNMIFACHYPFVNFPGMYFSRMHQERSYVLALLGAGRVDGMYIGEGDNHFSFRNYGEYLLLGGANHRTGENSGGGCYDVLREKAKELYPDSQEAGHWSAQDCMTIDKVPYIGPYASGKPDWYVATGFQKWGMSTSMAAAMILKDRICHKEKAYAEVFRPNRFIAEKIPNLACESGQAIKGLARRIFKIPVETAEGIAPGRGGIIYLDGEKAGVYKDENNEIFAVDVRCPHLGCQLEWNPDEFSWDCPCHGSRFDYQGKLLEGPAQRDANLD